MTEELLAQVGSQVGFGVIQKRRNVVLQRTFAAALVVKKKWLDVASCRRFAEHDVAGLEVAVEKIIAPGIQQEFRQPVEIVFQRLLIERNTSKAKKIVFEIIQVPRDRLAIKAGARVADAIV